MTLQNKRLYKELKDLKTKPPPSVNLVDTDSLEEWKVMIDGATSSLYEGERFTLRFRFKNYPMEAPEVVFIGKPPIHPHIYSNGHICLSILYDSWTPALRVESICISILSMLSSCTEKVFEVYKDQSTRR